MSIAFKDYFDIFDYFESFIINEGFKATQNMQTIEEFIKDKPYNKLQVLLPILLNYNGIDAISPGDLSANFNKIINSDSIYQKIMRWFGDKTAADKSTIFSNIFKEVFPESIENKDQWSNQNIKLLSDFNNPKMQELFAKLKEKLDQPQLMAMAAKN